MFKGSITALITPFKNNKVDEDKFRDFIEWQISEGSHGFVPCGTTGESPTLNHQEHMRVTEICIEVVKKRVPVMAGCGSNSTDEAISLVSHAQKAGAEAALVVTPYYNKPTQEGLFQHFRHVAESTSLPIYIYNIPSRSVVDMDMKTLERLAKIENISGIKDASCDLERPGQVVDLIGKNFCQLSGEDETVLPFLEKGGVGCISVTANVAPKLCSELHEVWAKQDTKTLEEIDAGLQSLHKAMFCETSPGPVKFALSLLGHCLPDMRLPLVEIAEESKQIVKDAMIKAGLISK
ncbi:MAG: 4-hydroxy-tetrahydrodipicolinate synthase [Alphaproteobacteria bacterium MarineAlpha7_Bin1]|nr:MAG: 4-hydroxy-tetrahydrodipicolinate synthase [Alphaproteobacteria bacterium MarineAlpha7_Bin1]